MTTKNMDNINQKVLVINESNNIIFDAEIRSRKPLRPLWYRKQDLHKVKIHIHRTIIEVRNNCGDVSKLDHDKYCIRGLEDYLLPPPSQSQHSNNNNNKNIYQNKNATYASTSSSTSSTNVSVQRNNSTNKQKKKEIRKQFVKSVLQSYHDEHRTPEDIAKLATKLSRSSRTDALLRAANDATDALDEYDAMMIQQQQDKENNQTKKLYSSALVKTSNPPPPPQNLWKVATAASSSCIMQMPSPLSDSSTTTTTTPQFEPLPQLSSARTA